ncbi:MAG: SH3 domain-containing protein [Chloroflexota bacterium]
MGVPTGKKVAFWVLVSLSLVMVACNAPARLTPTATALALPTAVPTPAATQPPPSPTSTPTKSIPLILTTPPATATPIFKGPYAVILLGQGETLNVRQAAGTDQPIVGQLTTVDKDILLTGRESAIGDQLWVEIRRSAGDTGWVNAHYLSEYVLSEAFCADAQVPDLIEQFKAVILNQDGEVLSALVSPTHGLSVTYLRTGRTANYSREEARWVFSSDYVTNWGTHPASGLEIQGTFRAEVLPTLVEVLSANYTQTCNDPGPGGMTYLYTWPVEYTNLNYQALHKPGTPSVDLDWRTWLVGVEYIDGKAYLFALLHLFWEP